jgi:hypothetical protein
MGKKNNLMPFVLGAAAGAVLTWLLTSEEGKKVAKNWEAKASDFLEENKTKTETNGN